MGTEQSCSQPLKDQCQEITEAYAGHIKEVFKFLESIVEAGKFPVPYCYMGCSHGYLVTAEWSCGPWRVSLDFECIEGTMRLHASNVEEDYYKDLRPTISYMNAMAVGICVEWLKPYLHVD